MAISSSAEPAADRSSTYAEDVVSWRPWYGLAAHRPLGSINRLRRRGYEELGAQRHLMNAVAERNPTGLGGVPA